MANTTRKDLTFGASGEAFLSFLVLLVEATTTRARWRLSLQSAQYTGRLCHAYLDMAFTKQLKVGEKTSIENSTKDFVMKN